MVNRPSNSPLNFDTDFERSEHQDERVELREYRNRMRDNVVMQNVVETVQTAQGVEALMNELLSTNQAADTISERLTSRNVERLMGLHESVTGLDLGSTHGELFAQTILTIEELYQYVGLRVMPDGTVGEGIVTRDMDRLQREAQRGAGGYAWHRAIAPYGGAAVGTVAATGALAAGASAFAGGGFMGTLAGASVLTGPPGWIIGGATLVGVATADVLRRNARGRRLAVIQSNIDRASERLDEYQEKFYTLSNTLEIVANTTSQLPTFTGPRAEMLAESYSVALSGLNQDLVATSARSLPDFAEYRTKVEELNARYTEFDQRAAEFMQIDLTNGEVTDFSALGLDQAALETRREEVIDRLMTRILSGNSVDSGTALEELSALSTKWQETAEGFYRYTGFHMYMTEGRANVEAGEAANKQELISFADRTLEYLVANANRLAEGLSSPSATLAVRVPATIRELFELFSTHPEPDEYGIVVPVFDGLDNS